MAHIPGLPPIDSGVQNRRQGSIIQSFLIDVEGLYMDRSDLITALEQGAVGVFMKDGKYYEIADHKSCLVDSTTAYVLYRRDDGKLKAHWLALVSMNRIESIGAATI